ncbi:MAG: hydantoinase/oxoprolinase family protein [Thermoanaerobaculia bacterium]
MPDEPVWRVAVDTGGTFTDCLATDPDGTVHRLKLLSSGALRSSVRDQPNPRELVLNEPATFPDGFFGGWTLSADGQPAIEVDDSEGSRLRLGSECPQLDEGSALVLRSGTEAAVLAIRWIMGLSSDRKVPALELRLATTRGTNALLERKGSEVALFVTRGFEDLLLIGNQQRPDLFALDIRRAEPLWTEVVGVDERLDAGGGVVRPLDEDSVRVRARELAGAGLRSAAVAFVHAYRDSDHEDRCAGLLSEAGFRHVSRSSGLSRRIKLVERARTAVVDAYLAETLDGYLDEVSEQLGPRTLHVMTSAGGLAKRDEYRAKDSLLSGPAAGVVGAAAAGRRSGFDRVIAFDMGGTSTDVSRVDGELELRDHTAVGGARLLSASVAVQTVAAGGGSICQRRGRRVAVGPESAGADPGPACYGENGPLTLTDVNLLLGRLVPSRFPFRVDREAALRRALEVGAAAGHPDLRNSDAAGAGSTGAAASGAGGALPPEIDAFLAGFLAIANERMAGAIRAISVRCGYDPREYALVAFGGAGGQHAIALAELLGIETVVVPSDGAILSAVGLRAAAVERWAERQVLAPLAEVGAGLATEFGLLAGEARGALLRDGVTESSLEVGPRTVFLRYSGQESTLAVPWRKGTTPEDLDSRFRQSYEALYGYLPAAGTLEVESLRLGVRSAAGIEMPAPRGESVQPARDRGLQTFWDGREWVQAPVLERAELSREGAVVGPALIAESDTVTVVERGWRCRSGPAEALVLEATESKQP